MKQTAGNRDKPRIGIPGGTQSGERTFSRRSLLHGSAAIAGAYALRNLPRARELPTHVFSFIGEFSQTGAFVSSVAYSDEAVGLAVSQSFDLSGAFHIEPQPVAPDNVYRHDLRGLLSPGSTYYARLTAHGTPFGRTMSFRTQVDDATPMYLKVALLSCQRNAADSDGQALGWEAVQAYRPDLILHGGDFGYWGGKLRNDDPYTKQIANYASQCTGITAMRDCFESACSLVQTSDHETSSNDGDNYNDPKTAVALEAYFRLMPYRTFDDITRRSRFLTRRLGTNVRLVAPDFRSLDRSPGQWVDNASKTAWGDVQFALFVAAMKQPEALKIILSDPGASPADPPIHPVNERLLDKWCNYRTAYAAFADVIRNERTHDGKPIQAEVWSGDRHLLGYLAEADNSWGPFDVLTSSGIDQDPNGLEAGELYTQVFGNRTGHGQRVKQHMEIVLDDSKTGTITRSFRGVNDMNGETVMVGTKTWQY